MHVLICFCMHTLILNKFTLFLPNIITKRKCCPAVFLFPVLQIRVCFNLFVPTGTVESYGYSFILEASEKRNRDKLLCGKSLALRLPWPMLLCRRLGCRFFF